MKYIDADLLRKEIERRITDNTFGAKLELIDILAWLDTLSEEPDKGLEEAAEEYSKRVSDGHNYRDLTCGFIAGAEWQKEQDQPIIGNSLEQEWLRYVDRKKKEYGGELPSLGEYGWLQIARHFAEWQASQMPMPEDTVLFQKGVAEGRRLEREDSVECEVTDVGINYLDLALFEAESLGLKDGDKVRIVVLKEEK